MTQMTCDEFVLLLRVALSEHPDWRPRLSGELWGHHLPMVIDEPELSHIPPPIIPPLIDIDVLGNVKMALARVDNLCRDALAERGDQP